MKQRFERVPDLVEGTYTPRKPLADLETVRALAAIATDSGSPTVERALLRLKSLPNCHVFRADLLNEMLRGLRESRREGALTLTEAVQRTRQRSRIVGRPVGRRIVATPRLVKGLEFDHAIVLDVEDYEREELYVALSRAARSTTVVSAAPTVASRDSRNR